MKPLRSLLGLACAATLLVPGMAAAQGGVDVKLSAGAKWPDREILLSFPAKRDISNDAVTVFENGQRVNGARVTPASGQKRGVVLAIDASLTMRGEPIRQAMVAARSFARRRAENTPVGVIFFSREPRVALPPTTNAEKIRTALAVGPALTRGTKIFDAAGKGVEILRSAGLTSGAIIVLSDGAEAQKGSELPVGTLTAQARARDVRIFSVGLASRSFDDTALRTMSDDTGGRYGLAARPQDLPPLFAAIGDRLSSEFIVSYQSGAQAGTPVAVKTRIDGVPGTVDFGYDAPELTVAAFKAGPHASDGLDGSKLGVLAILGFLVLTVVMFLLVSPKRASVVSRVGAYAPGGGWVVPALADDEEVKVKREPRGPTSLYSRYEEAVELSGIPVSPASLALWTATGTLALVAYFGYVQDRPPFMAFALFVPFGVRLFVLNRLAARRRDFDDQLPDNLQVLASALRAGYSFSAAMASMAEDAAEPSKSELRRASGDEQLGVDVSEALAAVGKRMQSDEIEYVGIVARMQRESGGNTAEVLDQVIETVRARQQLKRLVRALTAQSRFGGGVVSVLPVVVVFIMTALNPDYFDPLMGETLGYVVFGGAAAMVAAGWLIIRKIVDVKV